MRLVVVMATAVCLAACGQKTVLVEASGTVQAYPDMARVVARVQTYGTTVQAAVSESNRRVQAILDGLKADGLDPKFFGALDFSVQQSCEYDNSVRKRVCSGYESSNNIVVEVSDLSMVGTLLGRLGELGADEVDRPGFRLKDAAKLASDARAAAIEDARQQARSYARASGWRLGKIINIESSVAVGSQYGRLRYLRIIPMVVNAPPGPMALNYVPPPTMASPGPVPVEPEMIDVTDNIFVQFELRGTWNVFADEHWW